MPISLPASERVETFAVFEEPVSLKLENGPVGGE